MYAGPQESPLSIDTSTLVIFEYFEVALPVKITLLLAVGFSAKLLQTTTGFSAGGAGVEVGVTVATDVEQLQLV